jgi:hypothetical protein
MTEILRYMEHSGPVTQQLEELILSCLEMLASVSAPRHVMIQLPCTVTADHITIDTLNIKSFSLASCLANCTRVYMFAATLGADVDRLISGRVKIDSAEALCIQACASSQLEDYCGKIEQELAATIAQDSPFCQPELFFRPRFSPGYGDFDIAHQTDVLRLLNAYKRIGVTETKTHILTPLKSVTAIIGVSPETGSIEPKFREQSAEDNNCETCGKSNCRYSKKGRI